MAEKTCHNCKKVLEESFFTDEKGKVLSKCNNCRVKLIKTTNKCSICGVKALYNILGQNEGVRCKEHKEIDMTNIKNKKCKENGCKKQPNYNFKGEKTALFCSDHKQIGMVDVKSKTCEFKDCKKHPNFNFQGEKIGRFCLDHKELTMLNIKNKICEFKSCNIQSSYGLPGTSKTHCAKHKKPGMIKNPTKRCSTKDCKEYATHGFKDPVFCENHAEKDHYNLCERKCTNQSCPYPERLDILNREGLCVTFCSLIKRDQMMKTHIKKKEEFIGNLLKTEIKQELSHRDQIIDSSCSKVRPDFVFDCGTHFVIIEVDEHQHKSYSNCGSTVEERQKMENKRMFMIFQSFGGPRVAFIRYNPDVFRVNDKVVTMGDQKRHKCLLQWVKHYLKNQPENPLEVKYLFYDGYDESDRTMISICEQDVM
jgi:hypothetical protein